MATDLNKVLAELNSLEEGIDDIVTQEDIMIAEKILAVTDKYIALVPKLRRAGIDVGTFGDKLEASKERVTKLIREFG